MRIETSTWPAVKKYFDEGNDLVILAIGSTEEHGRHNPLGVDTIAPNFLLDLIEKADPDVLIAPTIPYGACDDLLGYPGTLSIGYKLLYEVVKRLCDQLYDYGARRLVLLNGHGPNIKPRSQVGVELDYPIAFDEEPITNGDVARTDGISNSQLTANALAFCQVIENAGYTPMIYGNQHDLAKLDLTGELAAYDVWLAEYEVSAPTARTDFVMWQYTENGTVSGIPTTEGWVDLNIRFLVE